MFDVKKKNVSTTEQKKKVVTPEPVVSNPFASGHKNPFVNNALKSAAQTPSGNGALKFNSTGNELVDQFGVVGSYKKPRTYEEISRDMSKLWNHPYSAMCFVFFLRLITRTVQFFDGSKTETVQRGSGMRHEGIMRMIWVHINHQDIFWKNIKLYIAVGSWKDIITMLQTDLVYNGWEGRMLDWDKFGKLLIAGLENPNTSELIKKYIPHIKASRETATPEAQADTVIGKWLCSLLFGPKPEGDKGSTYAKYRKMKSQGTAHQWQQLISQGKHELIDFNTVHGRALAQMVSGKYIENQKLTARYQAWISEKPVAKFTGFVHELFETLNSGTQKYQVDTINAQFAGLVQTAKTNADAATRLIVVRDTSASMGSLATGTKSTCYNIGKGLALFFSEMLDQGPFADSWIEFNSTAILKVWQGTTPVEKWKNDRSGFVGGTNFQSVIQLFCRMKQQGIAESDFPTGILCISDSEFNPAQLGKTNVQMALSSLRGAGFSEDYVANFKIILWNLQSSYYGSSTGKKFETYGDVDNVYYFSGFDGSTIAFLTGVEGQVSIPKNAGEVVKAALEQEIMKLIEV